MDNLLNQMRSNYSGFEKQNREQSYNRKDAYLVPQTFQTYQEQKTTGNWLGGQFSQQMSRGNEFSDDGIERVAAVAAAVFAIHSVEELEFARPKKKVDRPERSSFPKTNDRPETSSFPQTNNLKKDTRTPPPRPAPEPSKVSRWLSGKDIVRDNSELEGSDEKVAVISEQQKQRPTEQKLSDPGAGDASYFKNTNSFSGNKPDIFGSRRSSTEPQKPLPIPTPRPPTPPVSRKPSTGPTGPTTGPPDIKKPGPIQTKPSDPRQTRAELWEKTEMAKIKQRYQKVNETISYWENKKRDKALRKFQESQAVGVKRKTRERGRKKFEEDMEFIKQIAGEARGKADEKRKNEILKANQKADIIRRTGDLPVTCYCC